MGKSVKRNWLLITIGFILLLNIGVVLGAEATNVLESAFAGIGNIDLGKLYTDYPQLCDGIFYIVFFIALFKAVMSKIELFKGNNTIPIITAIAFAMSMMVLSNMMKPKLLLLKAISPIALLIAAGAMGVFIYQMIKDMTKANVFAAAISIAVVLILITFITSPSIFGSKTGGYKVLTSTKQYATLSLFLLFPIGIGQVWRNLGLNVKSPNNSERRDEKTFFPKQTEAIEKIEDVEKGLGKAVADDKPETDLLEEEKGLEKFDEYENLLDSEAIKFTKQIEGLDKTCQTGEEREKGMLSALSDYGNNIDNTLAKMSSVDVIDQAGKKYIIQNIQGIAQVCDQIVQNQKQVQKDRKDTMGNLLTDDIKKLNHVISSFKKIDQALRNIDRNISSDIGNSLIKKAEAEITKQNKELEKSLRSLESNNFTPEQKQSMSEAFTKLQQKKNTNDAHWKTIEAAKTNIKQAADALDNQLVAVRDILQDMDLAKRTINNQSQKNVKALAGFDTSIAEMEAAALQLNHEMIELGKQDSIIAEEVPVKAAEGIAKMFNSMISNDPNKLGLQLKIMKFYEEDVLPSVKDLRDIVDKSNRLNTLISPMQVGIGNINTAYSSLKVATEAIIGGAAPKNVDASNKITQVMKYVDGLIASEQNIRTRVANEVMTALDKVTTDVTNEIPKVNTEIEKLRDSQKRVLGELSKALKIIVDNKSRADKKFETSAKEFNTKMAEATQNITQGKQAA